MDLGVIALLTSAWVLSVCAASQNETADICVDYGEAFERVFAIPDEAALLNCEIVKVSPQFRRIPYNVTWFDKGTGLELTGDQKHMVLHGSSLLFFNINMEHQGHYLCVVRTPEKCYKQVKVLVVDEMAPGACRRPRAAVQRMNSDTNDDLRCPLRDYVDLVDSFSIDWYKLHVLCQGCQLLHQDSRLQFTEDNLVLRFHRATPKDAGFYTCRMTFNLTGVTSVVTETIECEIIEKIEGSPKMLEPADDGVKVAPGSAVNKTCRVFLPGNGIRMTSLNWDFNGESVSKNSFERIHQGPISELQVSKGWWVERSLVVSQVLSEDFHQNFTCSAITHRGCAYGNYTLQPADPDLLLPIGLLASMMTLLFIMGVLLYREFKVELVLLFRTLFLFFYESTDGDGKLYDAYVVYPRGQGDTLSEAVEAFAIKTLPQVLEERYGYRLFILGRDSLPGQAIADVMEETMNLCRRMVLLYTRSSLSNADGLSWFEQQTGLHRTLLEETLSVMLLEMEQLSDLSILPESLRLLRDKQGAVQAWQKKRRWGCTTTAEDGNVPLTSFSLSARSWNKVCYYMPVRGKAKRPFKRKLLLDL
ncbi:interleukin-1 receptor type 1 isoform X1 [Clarias gariepinus]|uniref:interleukin-1 receptor type 1 isoform X1 n=1 Tax=Clarias gariepinus TaxID=13013 RepID=UPI00234D00CF|nr:interleukin-1 receptor type 1 isoform X1 [Clarias gariepinus]XP_053352584.1 interleukin-1 receptor type 1 isoform X1 [Clarias gariepinus]XP_053352585.1 interleukin-1 receptor type 1 isoform X1 [Clarias gariepinus]